MTEIVFSPTGGTEKVVEAVTESLGYLDRIDLSDMNEDFSKISLSGDDTAFIAVPSFGGRAPAIAIERLKQIKGNGANAVIIAVYGNRDYEDTLVELEDAAKEAGFNVVAAIAAVAEHSIMPQYATGRPNGEDFGKLSAFGKEIQKKIESGDNSTPEVPGNRPYKDAGSIPLVPKANSNCDNCKICIINCPVGAIDAKTLKADKEKCISCMRCIHICPKGARKTNKLMVSAAALAIKKACSTKKENELFI